MSLKLVWDNREGKEIFTCNVCGRQGKWSNRWVCMSGGVGVGYRGEDRYYFTCSKECREKDEKEKLRVHYMKDLHEKWWEANGDYVDDFEKDFKKIMDKEFEKMLSEK